MRRQRLPYDIKVTVSGSFSKNIHEVIEAVEKFTVLGATILSPAEPHITGWHKDFALLQSDKVDNPTTMTGAELKAIEDTHCDAIRRSDFLWIATLGYMGPSTAFEFGHALSHNVPIYGKIIPMGDDGDDVAAVFMQQVNGYEEAVERALRRRAAGFRPQLA